MLIWRTLVLTFAVLLTGCANMWNVSNDVESFASWTQPPNPVRFRFERLPSQQANASAQTTLEQMALPVLNQAGLVLDEAAPAYSLQVGTYQQETTQWGGPYWGGSVFFSHGYVGRGMQMGMGFPIWREPPRSFERQVSLVLRDLSTGQVVYESHASLESRNPTSTSVLPLMLGAALQGFPLPPPGIRKVVITIPH